MRLTVGLLVVVLLSGCGGSSGSSTSTATIESTAPATSTTALAEATTSAPTTATTLASTTSAPSTTTTATPTSTVAATTAATTTTSGGPYVVVDPEFYPPAPLPGSGDAAGSGCSPGAGPLPDGVWFGYVVAKSAGGIDFDLACFYFGEIAYAEGAADGEEVNNDYYVRNANPTVRTIPVAASVDVWEVDAGSIGYLEIPFSDWPLDPTGYIACPSEWCGVWLFVNGGNVTEILEQYVP